MNKPQIDELRFTVMGEPVGKGRARSVTRNSKARGSFIAHITPQKTVDYEAAVRAAAKEAMGYLPAFTGPVMLELRIYMSVATSWSQKRSALALAGEILPTKKPDADNVLKAVKDAMNEVVYADDAQVTDVHMRKRFAEQPRVEVIITPLAKSGI